MTNKLSANNLHTLPLDLKNTLYSNKHALEKWVSLTPLAQNEWICWVITVKKPETRTKHINRVIIELIAGKRRPCCWPGCPHRQKLKYNKLM